jgi:phosphoribosylanthranilate isomerase
MTWIKICGITSVDDAEHAVRSGANAIGLNFVLGSKRRITLEQARPIIEAMRGRIELTAVVADPTDLEAKELRALGIEWLQLHGDEPAARLTRLLPQAFKAVAIEDAADARRAASFPGDRLLVDTKVSGVAGGTGKVFDWQLVTDLARSRQLILAGGLTPKNVAAAVRVLQPWGVDVASGVELVPGVKDPELVTAFVLAVRSAGDLPSR